jgi:hypothetical protein
MRALIVAVVVVLVASQSSFAACDPKYQSCISTQQQKATSTPPKPQRDSADCRKVTIERPDGSVVTKYRCD